MTTETESSQPATLPVALVVEAIAGLALGAVMAIIAGIACALLLHWTGLDNQLGMGSLGVTLYAGLLGFAVGQPPALYLPDAGCDRVGATGWHLWAHCWASF